MNYHIINEVSPLSTSPHIPYCANVPARRTFDVEEFKAAFDHYQKSELKLAQIYSFLKGTPKGAQVYRSLGKISFENRARFSFYRFCDPKDVIYSDGARDASFVPHFKYVSRGVWKSLTFQPKSQFVDLNSELIAIGKLLTEATQRLSVLEKLSRPV